MSRVRARIRLTDAVRQTLISLSKKHSFPHKFIQRVKIILSAEKEQSNKNVAAKLSISVHQVTKWTHQWEDTEESNLSIEERLSDAARSGKPSKITARQLCQLVALACDDPNKYERPISHWTQKELADEAIKQNIFTTISPRHIGRLLAGLDLKPHKNKYWLHKKIDEYREQKIVEICGLYQEAIDLKKRNNNS